VAIKKAETLSFKKIEACEIPTIWMESFFFPDELVVRGGIILGIK